MKNVFQVLFDFLRMLSFALILLLFAAKMVCLYRELGTVPACNQVQPNICIYLSPLSSNSFVCKQTMGRLEMKAFPKF